MKMDRKLTNAIVINFNNLISSEAIKLTTIITFLIACCFSFWPWLHRHILGNETSTGSVGGYISAFAVCIVFMIFMTLLIARVGTRVGFEKGSKVTEIILTSISRKQLFIAHVFSSILVVVVVMLIVYLPLIVGSLINNPEITLTFKGVSLKTWLFLLVHALETSLGLVIFAVAIASVVKQSEDIGPYMILVVFPFLLSNIYFTIKSSMFDGVVYFLNYVPACSLIPAVGASIIGNIGTSMKIAIIFADTIWIIVFYQIGKRVFIKNIAER